MSDTSSAADAKQLIKKGQWLGFIDPRGDEFTCQAMEDEAVGKVVLMVRLYNDVIALPVKDIIRDK